MTAFNVIRICALTCCLIFGFTTMLFAQETAKTEANSDTTSSGITLSAEEDALLIGIAQFRDNLNRLQKAGKKTTLRILIADDQGKLTAYGAEPNYEKRVLEGDDATVLQEMQKYNYEFLFPLDDKYIHIGIRGESSPEYQLFRAAMVNNLELAQRLVNEYEIDPTMEFKTSTIGVDRSALTVAVISQHSEMVELLLKDGANPLEKTRYYGSQLRTAIDNRDTISTRALFEAGATISDAFKKNNINTKMLKQILKDKNTEFLGLLLDNGMELKKPVYRGIIPPRADTDTRLFTPLMEALLSGDNDMIAALLPHSDPRYMTPVTIPRSNSGIETIKILPRANALYIAQVSPAELEPNITQALTDRIEALGGEDAVTMSNIDLASSQSEMAYLEGDLELAKEILGAALHGLSASDIKRSNEERYVATVKYHLTRHHELAVMTNNLLSDAEQALTNELAGVGRPTGHWHSMLETIQQATTGDYFPMLDEWLQQYADRDTRGWDYSRLDAWIRTISDSSAQKRAFRAVDYFQYGLNNNK